MNWVYTAPVGSLTSVRSHIRTRPPEGSYSIDRTVKRARPRAVKNHVKNWPLLPAPSAEMTSSSSAMNDVPLDSDVVIGATRQTGKPATIAAERALQLESSDSTVLLEVQSQLAMAKGAVVPHHLRRAPVWGTATNSIAFMLIPRSVPACFAATGWSIGVLGLVYSSLVTYDTGIILGRLSCAMASKAECSFPALAGEAGARLAASGARDSLQQQRWRARATRLVAVMQHATFYLTGVAELIYFEQYMGQLFTTSPLCQWQWLLIVALASVPVLQVPSFNATRFAALAFGIMPLIVNVVVFFYQVALVAPWDCSPGPRYTWWPTPARAAVGLSAMGYAFGELTSSLEEMMA